MHDTQISQGGRSLRDYRQAAAPELAASFLALAPVVLRATSGGLGAWLASTVDFHH